MNNTIQLVTMTKDIEKALKDAIVRSGLTAYRLSKDTGLSQYSIGWFVQGKRTLRLDIAAKLAKRLGLELIETKRPQIKRRKLVKG